MKDFDVVIGANSFPVCPICGGNLRRQQDCYLSESGYANEGSDIDNDCVVHIMTCPECRKMYDIVDAPDGVHFLSVCDDSDENLIDEPNIEYTKYAKKLLDAML